MTNFDRMDLINSTRDSATNVSNEIGPETFNFLLDKYGVDDIDDLDEGDLSNVFNEIYAIEADLR